MKKLTMEHSRKALEYYDKKDKPFLDWILNHIKTQTEFKLYEQAEKEALNKVRLAFFEDTKDRSSKDNCMIVSISFIRETILKWNKKNKGE